jgi:hypothetical protein
MQVLVEETLLKNIELERLVEALAPPPAAGP